MKDFAGRVAVVTGAGQGIGQRMDAVGQPVVFAPLSEVADLCLAGIRADTFWITVPSDVQSAKILARAHSQVERTDPDYLLEANLMAARPATTS